MSKQIRADLFLLVITAIWGSSFPLMKNVLEHIPSFAYLAVRFAVAAVILLFIFRRHLKNINRKVLVHGFVLGLTLSCGMILQVTGLYYTTASNSAFITGLNVVMVPVISAVLLKKKPGANSVIGVILAACGLFFLSGGLSFSLNKGDILTLIGAVCFAFQIILIDKFTEKQEPVLLATLEISFAALVNNGIWLLVERQPVKFDLTVVITLLITGVFGTALAYAGQSVVQRFTSPTHTALIFTAEPVFGAIFAMLIPNSAGETESLGMYAILGCVLILLGMIISEIKTEKKQTAHQNSIYGSHERTLTRETKYR